jgi:hypothetical protein
MRVQLGMGRDVVPIHRPRIRRSRDMGAYFGLVPRRYQSGEVDYGGGISKCGDWRMRTLLYEAANVMLTRYKANSNSRTGPSRSPSGQMRKARVALARRFAIIMYAMLRDGVRIGLSLAIHETGGRIKLPREATPQGGSRRRRG